jgi:hypothetical protein
MEACDPGCAALGIPAYLHKNGRESNQEFLPDEDLFIRFRVEERKLKSVINFRKQSANRSLYCQKADDVLYDSEHGGRYAGVGVYSISVRAILGVKEELIEGNSVRSFTARPLHMPDRCNYAHTEIHAYENGNRVDDISSKSVKKRIREEFLNSIQVLVPSQLAGMKFERD